MSQLSKPYQYALVVVLVLAGAWMLVLRPSAEDGEDTPVPAAVAPAPAAGATPAAASPVAASPTPAVTPGSAAAPAATDAPTAKAKPKATPEDPSRPILDALAAGKVAVVLFYEDGAADDRAVRRTLRDLPGHGGRVQTFTVRIADVGQYAAITRGVQVLAAPTVLVIGSDRVASTITGYTEVGEIDQLVGDALRRTVAADAAPAVPGEA